MYIQNKTTMKLNDLSRIGSEEAGGSLLQIKAIRGQIASLSMEKRTEEAKEWMGRRRRRRRLRQGGDKQIRRDKTALIKSSSSSSSSPSSNQLARVF